MPLVSSGALWAEQRMLFIISRKSAPILDNDSARNLKNISYLHRDTEFGYILSRHVNSRLLLLFPIFRSFRLNRERPKRPEYSAANRTRTAGG